MAIKHSTSKVSGERGYAADWNADHTVTDPDLSKRSASRIVAAYDSLDKGRADYVCDGVADQAEINQAITDLAAAGGRVCLLEGSFYVSGTINLASGVALSGQGYSSVISRVTGTLAWLITVSAGVTGASVADLCVDGKRSLTGSNLYGCISLGGTYNFVSRCHVLSCKGHGVAVSGSCNAVTGSHISDTGRSGVFISTNSGATITGNFITGSGQIISNAGVWLYGSSCRAVLASNVISGGTADGVDADSSANRCTVTGNVITGNAGTGINFTGSEDYNVIVSNVVYGNTGGQITTTGSHDDVAHNIVG